MFTDYQFCLPWRAGWLQQFNLSFWRQNLRFASCSGIGYQQIVSSLPCLAAVSHGDKKNKDYRKGERLSKIEMVKKYIETERLKIYWPFSSILILKELFSCWKRWYLHSCGQWKRLGCFTESCIWKSLTFLSFAQTSTFWDWVVFKISWGLFRNGFLFYSSLYVYTTKLKALIH